VSREIFQHQWITICESQQGIPFVRFDDGVMIVPLTAENEILLIAEPSGAYDRQVLLLPAGGVDAGESPSNAANRELQEEIAYKAGRLDYLGRIHPAVKYIEGHLDIYLGRNLLPSRLEGDEAWTITTQRIPINAFETLIADGRLSDASAVASLYMARQFLLTEREKDNIHAHD
jgi:ADP-ribose diphosphatase